MREIIALPARSTSVCEFGVNVQGTSTDLVKQAAAKVMGARHFRTQYSWSNVENYSTGVMALTAPQEAFLAWCGTNDVKPSLVAGYGPPYSNLGTVTVQSNVSIGATTIPITTDATTLYDFPHTHIMTNANGQIVAEGKWGYYGALLVNPIAPSFPAVSVVDAFNRANEDPITGWTTISSLVTDTFRVSSNTILPSASNATPNRYGWARYNTSYGPNQECFVTMVGTGSGGVSQGFSLYCRIKEVGSQRAYYTANFNRTSGGVWSCDISRADLGGAEVVLWSNASPTAPVAGESFGLRTYGNKISLWRKLSGGSWTLAQEVTDERLTAGGYTGLYLSRDTALDDFGAGNIPMTSLELAAPTSIAVNAGTVLRINRLKYPTILNDTDPGHAKFAAYVQFLADRIAANGAEGWVNLWNEINWSHDQWHSRRGFYATPPSEVTSNDNFNGSMLAVKNLTLPAGVKVINGTSDKTGFNSIYGNSSSFTGISGSNVGTFSHDGIHPYGDAPEAAYWHPTEVDPFWTGGTNWMRYLRYLDRTGNFRYLAKQIINNGSHIKIALTETGAELADDNRQALSLIRRLLMAWGYDQHVSIYNYDENNANFDIIGAGGTPRQSYYAIQRLNTLVENVGFTTDPTQKYPTLSVMEVSPLFTWRVFIMTFMGTQGSLTAMWQATHARHTGENWQTNTVPTPTAQQVRLLKPSSSNIVSCTTPVNGSSVSYSLTGNELTVDVGESPVVIEVE